MTGRARRDALGCVLVPAERWLTTLDQLLNFRTRLKQKFGIPVRAEIKAAYLLRNSGSIRDLNLGPGARGAVFRAHLRVLRDLDVRVFSIVVDKRDKAGCTRDLIFDLAWEGLLQRLERTSTRERAHFMIMHDEGEDETSGSGLGALDDT